MSVEQREYVLSLRRLSGDPWHGPPHRVADIPWYHLMAANYEHKPIIGSTPERIAAFEGALLETVSPHSDRILAGCVLPNHYHLLLESHAFRALMKAIGQLHGRLSFVWNTEDGARGRTCWHRCSDRSMRSERHLNATLNYIHHNPVHHRYVKQWQDWLFSSARRYIENVGHDAAARMWREYPVLDYGKGWDDPEL